MVVSFHESFEDYRESENFYFAPQVTVGLDEDVKVHHHKIKSQSFTAGYRTNDAKPVSVLDMCKSQEKLADSDDSIKDIKNAEKVKENKEKENGEEKEQKKRYSCKQWLTLLVFALGSFSIGACHSLQAPFFPKEAEKKGASPTEYGFIFGMYELTAFFAAPLCGKLVGRVSPKLMIYSGIFIVGAASVAFGLLDRLPAGNAFVITAFVIRMIEGVGAAGVKTVTATVVAAQFPDNVAFIFSSLETSRGLGVIVGPMIGGILFQIGGYELPFVLSGGILVLDAIAIYLIAEDPDDETIKKKAGNLLSFLAHPGILLDALVIFVNYSCVGFNNATLEPHLRQFGLSALTLGSMFIISGATYAGTAPIWGRLCDAKINPRILNIIGCSLQAVVLLIIGPAPFFPFQTEMWMVIVSLVFFGLSGGGTLVSSFAGALKTTKARGYPDDVTTYGLVSAMFACSSALGAFTGPSLGGYLMDTIGYRNGTSVLFSMEVLVVILLLIYYFYERSKEKDTEDIENQPLLEEESPITNSYKSVEAFCKPLSDEKNCR